jgi:hypothetical protein
MSRHRDGFGWAARIGELLRSADLGVYCVGEYAAPAAEVQRRSYAVDPGTDEPTEPSRSVV